ncbi:MAG: hypothetical protein K6T83_21795 [Alicyclobacillus sp.]|nr:hypothetical protein [Alicyclobacillus sp.]
MAYEVNTSSPTLTSLSSFSGGLSALIAFTVPEPYKWILFGLMTIIFITAVWQITNLQLNNGILSFKENALVFPKLTIRPEDIKHIYVYERNRRFIIYFKQRRFPISIEFSCKDEGDIRAKLHEWTLKNGVERKMRSEFK